MCKSALPLDRAGTLALPKLPERELVSQYMGHHHVSEEILSEHFSAMFQQFLSGLASKDYSKLEKIAERRFLDALTAKKDDLNKFQLKFTPSTLDETAKSSYLVDSLLVKGIRHNREENDSNHDYMYVDTHENQGLRFYLHKYFLGFHPYYMEIKNKEFFNTQQELQQK